MIPPIFIQTVLSRYGTSTSDYNQLPMIFRIKQKNNLDLSIDLAGAEVLFPARANAKNLKLAERMRQYASSRTTR